MAKNLEIALLFDFYGDMLTDKQRDVVELYYDNDLSLSEIAENEGITRQGVRDSIKRAEAPAFGYGRPPPFSRRFRQMREGIAAIRQAAGEIQELNDRFGYSRDIEERPGRSPPFPTSSPRPDPPRDFA